VRILVCNDDGHGSPGIEAMAAVARAMTDDVWVVAPDGKRTAGSHALTLGRPLQITEMAPRSFACTGTPADSVAVAMTHLLADGPKPDLVLSGINDARNVAEDLAYSGTIGIAREATFWGIPALALSSDGTPAVDADALAWLERLVRELFTTRSTWCLPGHWLSINLPRRLPAALVPVDRIGSNKIGTRCEVIEMAGATTTLLMPRGRIRSGEPGDENDLLAQGFAVYSLQSWRAAVVDAGPATRALAAIADPAPGGGHDRR
jgi:5'-nucleotidase